MRVIPGLFLFLALTASPRAFSNESSATATASSEVNRVRSLVDAGALPRTALAEAENDLAEAHDEATLRETLYGKASVDELTTDRAADMLAAAERQVTRQQGKVDKTRHLVDEGLLPRTALTPHLEELDRRRRTADLAQSRVRLLEELAKLAKIEEAEFEAAPSPTENDQRVAVKFSGGGRFDMNDFRRVDVAYRKKFGKALPVSAMGMTALHRSLGFDHRGRVDVAINPDDAEGRWLRNYLENLKIPYFAFRAAVRGKATGAHIHLGPPSLRLPAYAKTRPATAD